MAFINAQQTRILYGAEAIASVVRDVKPSVQRDMLDVSTLADTSKAYIPGIAEWSLSISGMFDNTTGAGSVLDQMTSVLSASDTVATSIAPNGFTAGYPVWLLPTKEITYEVGAQVGDAVGFSLALGAASTPAIGISLADIATMTATTTGASQDNSASSTNGYVAHLHVTDSAGTTPSLITTIEHSTNNSTWSTLATFSTLTTYGSQTLSGTGTVNRYVRVKYTISGTTPSFTAQVSFGRL